MEGDSSSRTASGRASALAGPFRTLKFRLMLLITGVLVLVVGLPVAAFVYSLDRNYHEFATTMLEITTDFVYQRIEPELLVHDIDGMQERLTALADDPRIQAVRVFDPEGTVIFSSKPGEINRHVERLPDSTFLHRSGGEVEAFTRVGNVYAHHHPLYVEQRCNGCHAPQAAPIATLDVHASFVDSEYVYQYAKQLSITGGIVIIVVLWLLTNGLYSSQIEVRLRRILDGFEGLASGRYDQRVEMEGEHEIAALARGFNEMAAEIEAARKREAAYYTERLERADRLVTLGEIAAEIAHEVNNPAGIILARAELLREELADRGATDSELEDLDMIIHQTGRIADITRSILHYARTRPRTFEETDLAAVVRRSVKVLQPRFKKCGARVDVDMPDAPVTVYANGDQLEQVFCNLVNNSLDAVCGRRPEVTITCRPPDEGTSDGVCRIVVHDNGPGIPEDLADQVFSPFFTTKSDGQGTGLGLFIARNIIQSHGGTISLVHASDGGARLLIELPYTHGSA